MKDKFYNPEKAKEEKEIKDVITLEDEKRNLYLSKVKKDKNFQRYVIEEIIRPNITSLTDTSKLLTEKRTKEELADLIIANIKASQTLINILNKLL